MTRQPLAVLTPLGHPCDEISSYHFPKHEDGAEFWYNCALRKLVVYLSFNRPPYIHTHIEDALKFAADNDLDGVRINYSLVGDDIQRAAAWQTPEMIPSIPQPVQERAFNADYRTVDYDALIFSHALTQNVHVVRFEGERYVYKFMIRSSNQDTFEKEFQHYVQVRECDGVPNLAAVVTRHGRIRGLLLSFIDGQNLADEVPRPEQLWDITLQILAVAAGLERVGFYHTDLKCLNIVRRHSDGKIFFIDFGGGLTEGWYKPGSDFKLLFRPVEARDALYILGKTLWELWTSDIPEGELPTSILEPAQKIIVDCISERYNSIKDVRIKYCPK